MIKLFCSFLFILFCIDTFSQFTNILISNSNDPEEVSICINPKNTNQIVAAANINNVFHSVNGGETWIINQLSDTTNGVWGDPIIFTDTTGNFYYSHLSNPPSNGSWVDRIVFTKSFDGGESWWADGTSTGKNGVKVQDKEGVVVNKNTNEIYVTWTQFDHYESSNPSDSSIILFSKSSDEGLSWSIPIRINKNAGDCMDGDNTVEGAIPVVGPLGEIYVVWAGSDGLVFNKSLDNGVTWLPQELSIIDVPGGWNYNISGLERCNGLPQVKCDLSGGPNNGTIYINWTDQRNGSNDTDVWVVKSTNGGSTWSLPIRVNDDIAGKQQFLTWMDVDQKTGKIYCVFYDRRNYESSSSLTDVYLACSNDGGNSFSNYKINEFSFIPDPNVFFGDYIGISAVNNMIRPVWMAYDLAGLSVWTALIDGASLGINETIFKSNSPFELSQNEPNPFTQNTWIKFNIKRPMKIDLVVYDLLGNMVATLYEKEPFKEGDFDYIFNATSYDLKQGVYYYKLICDDYQDTKKMIVY